MRQRRIEAREGYRYCSLCKVEHPLITTDENGKEVETFGRLSKTRGGYQAWCKAAKSKYDVQQQRERRQRRQNEQVLRTITTDQEDEKYTRELSVRYMINSTRRIAQSMEKRRDDLILNNFPTSIHSGSLFNIKLDETIKLFEKFDYQCVVCGSSYPNIAHDVTLENGGLTEIGNIVPLCNLHKLQKGHRTLFEFGKYLGYSDLDKKVERVRLQLKHA